MIRVREVSYFYNNSKNAAVSGLNFEVKEGEIFGFLGPSGAGKTTTQKILTGLINDYQGSVEVLDKEIKQWGRNYYEHIGVSFELPYYFNKLTALENLNYFY
ncbi:MAG: ATP-binding cassette domain-containing protein [Halothermotrichaceae bacterium]